MRFNTRKPQATRSAEVLVAGTLEDKWRTVLKAAVQQLARSLRRGCRDRAGMALQLTVLLLVPAGLMFALAMDAGRLFVVRGEMQVAADAAALAGASSFIDGDEGGDAAQVRAQHFVTANPIGSVAAVLESLTVNPDSGTLKLVLRYQTGSLLLAPGGLTIRSRAGARARLVQPGQTGRAIPNENRLHWWKQDEIIPAGAADSGRVTLTS
jgi:hypothetical protein